MNTVIDNLAVVDTLTADVAVDDAAVMRSGSLPFSFSKAKQVVLVEGDAGLVLSYVGRLDTDT